MTRPDEILELIDVGLQTAKADPSFGEISPVNLENCARCSSPDLAPSSEFCPPCRAFLLGDGPEPRGPKTTELEPWLRASGDLRALAEAMNSFGQRLAEVTRPFLEAFSAMAQALEEAGLLDDRDL